MSLEEAPAGILAPRLEASQLSVTPTPGDPAHSSGLWEPVCVHTPPPHTNKNKIKTQSTYYKHALAGIDFVYKQKREKYVTDSQDNNANNDAICIYSVHCKI